MKNIIQEMEYIRNRCESFALATVITCNGSAPRSAGAKMIIKQNDTTVGMMGGGNIESQVKQLGGEMLKNIRRLLLNHINSAEMTRVPWMQSVGGR